MWNQIINLFLILIAATFIVQFFLPRPAQPSPRRTNLQWDIAPLIAFFGVLLVGLAFVESLRQHVIEAWALGSGIGVLGAISVGIARATRQESVAPPKSSWRTILQTMRTVGVSVAVVALSAYLAIRFFGAAVEVFLAGAFGIVLIGIGILVFADTQSALARKSNGK